MNVYIESFLPLFVAINLPAILPIFIGLTEGMAEAARRRLVIKSMTMALVVSMLILFSGQIIFDALGITLNDLRVGGGLILLVLSITDLVFGDARRRDPTDEEATPIDIVPLGIPLTVGPLALTTILVAQQSYGYVPTLLSLFVNLGLVVVGYIYGPAVLSKLGDGLMKAVAKVASLFLSAIAVAMIRAGLVGMLT